MLKNLCFQTVVLEKILESPLNCKNKPVNPKGNQPWIFIGKTDAEAEAPILWSLMWRADSLERTLMLGKTEGRRRGDNRKWDGWMVPPTQWTWIWANSGRWLKTGKPGVLQSMGSQRVGHDLMTEQQLENAILGFTVSTVQRGIQFKEYWCTVSTTGPIAESSKLHFLASSTTVWLNRLYILPLSTSNSSVPFISLSCFFCVTSLLKSWRHSRKSFRGISFQQITLSWLSSLWCCRTHRKQLMLWFRKRYRWCLW